MKKFFTLFAVIAALAMTTHSEVLTVCDGTGTYYMYPVFASEMDAGEFTQTIYPALMLADMQGDKINQVKYYSDSRGLSFSATLELSFKIVDYESFEERGEVWPENEVVAVATATVEKGATEMVFNLNEPYEYNGGNLLIQCKVISYDNPSPEDTYFLGTEATGGYPSYCYLGYLNYMTDHFRPKVTFTSEPASTPPTPSSGEIDGHEYVDLGLPSGTLWATCNVGADTPEGYGDYFAWGETEPKDEYSWANYKWCEGTWNTMTKYCYNSQFGYNGFVDEKTELDPEDDAAYVNWGSSWLMPTFEQQQELIDNCTSTWTSLNGVFGYLFTGPNGKTMFLPAAGDRYEDALFFEGSNGYYWSRTIFSSEPDGAYRIYFNSGGVYWLYEARFYGFPVRPVVEINETPAQTAKPTISGSNPEGGNAYMVEITPGETPCTIYYRVKFNNGAFGGWMEYLDGVLFTESGDYVVEAYAKAPDKEPSETVSHRFSISPVTGISEVASGKTVAVVRYFNAAGQEMAQPEGMTIMVTTYTDGTTTAVKVVK